MKVLKYFVIAIVVVFVSAVTFLTFSMGGVVKKSIETFAPDVLGVSVTVDSVDLSIINGSAKISGLTVGNPDGFKSEQAFKLGEVSVDLNPLSLFSDTIKINNISVISPEINYELGEGGSNINAIQKNIATEDASEPSKADKKVSEEAPSNNPSKKVIIENILISDTKVIAGIGGLSKEIKLPKITLKNIGKGDKPASIASATKLVLSTVLTSLAKIDLASFADTLKDEALKKGVKGVGDVIKGFFR